MYIQATKSFHSCLVFWFKLKQQWKRLSGLFLCNAIINSCFYVSLSKQNEVIMHTVIEGVYENGKITLDHKPDVNVRTKVKVIFEEIEGAGPLPSKRPFGIAKGTIHLAADFDDPLDDLKDYM